MHLIETLKATGREDDFFSRLGRASRPSAIERRTGLGDRRAGDRRCLPPVAARPSTPPSCSASAPLQVMDGHDHASACCSPFRVCSQQLLGADGSTWSASGSKVQEALGRHDPARRRAALPPRQATSPAPATAPTPTARAAGKPVDCRTSPSATAPLEPPLIEDFSLEPSRPGERVALVGASGSGKSSDRQARSPACYEPCNGEILFDGHALRRLAPRTARRASSALVDQDIRAVRGHHPREPHAVGRHRRRIASLIAARQRRADLTTTSRTAPGRLRRRDRGGRPQPQRRPAPAARDRPRTRPRTRHADPRRGDQRARCRSPRTLI